MWADKYIITTGLSRGLGLGEEIIIIIILTTVNDAEASVYVSVTRKKFRMGFNFAAEAFPGNPKNVAVRVSRTEFTVEYVIKRNIKKCGNLHARPFVPIIMKTIITRTLANIRRLFFGLVRNATAHGYTILHYYRVTRFPEKKNGRNTSLIDAFQRIFETPNSRVNVYY